MVETTSTLDPGRDLNVQVSFPRGYVNRGISGELQAWQENHQTGSATLEFVFSVLLNYLLTLCFLVAFVGKKSLNLEW
jgi:hypothetical protein